MCFDCHADAGHYFAGHPKGIKLSPEELVKHKAEWFANVERNQFVSSDSFELTINNNDFNGMFQPIFIKESTRFGDRNLIKRTYELLGKDPADIIKDMKERNGTPSSPYYIPFIHKIETYDQYIDFLNGEYPDKKTFYSEDENENKDCQPLEHNFPSFISRGSTTLENLSNCVLSLRFTNLSPEPLDTYKIYLTFENVVEVDTVNKRKGWDDLNKYIYNIHFLEWNKAEFIPTQNVLVQKDSIVLDKICFRTHHKTKSVKIKWQMLAKNVNHEGILSIQIKPKFKNEDRSKYVEQSEKLKTQVRYLPYIVVKR